MIVGFHKNNRVYILAYFQSPSFDPKTHIVIIFSYSALTECRTRIYAEH